jgi:hypothetical protein
LSDCKHSSGISKVGDGPDARHPLSYLWTRGLARRDLDGLGEFIYAPYPDWAFAKANVGKNSFRFIPSIAVAAE